MSNTVAIRLTRSDSNRQYANDASYESVEHLLERLAGKCYARVKKLGIPMDFDDVLSEMNLSYVKARQAWNPEAGALFSTYCTTACMNNFNNAIAKMERDRRELGLIPFSHFQRMEDGDASPEEFLSGIATDYTDAPERRIECAQEMQANLDRMTTNARRVIAGLLRDYQRTGTEQPKRLSQIMDELQLPKAEQRRIRIEISKITGVFW